MPVFFINFKRLLRFIRKRLVQQFFRITVSVIFQTNWMIYQVCVWENLVFHNAGSCYLWPQCLTLQGWNSLLNHCPVSLFLTLTKILCLLSALQHLASILISKMVLGPLFDEGSMTVVTNKIIMNHQGWGW